METCTGRAAFMCMYGRVQARALACGARAARAQTALRRLLAGRPRRCSAVCKIDVNIRECTFAKPIPA